MFANGFEPVYVPTRKVYDAGRRSEATKNSVDIHIAVDIVKSLFLHENVDVIILISGDRDYVPLINQIRQQGKQAYAIGVAEPVSVHVESYGTGAVDDRQLETLVRDQFPLNPAGIIEHLDLRRPIYQETAAYGHFGRPQFSWEETSRADEIRAAAGVGGEVPA